MMILMKTGVQQFYNKATKKHACEDSRFVLAKNLHEMF